MKRLIAVSTLLIVVVAGSAAAATPAQIGDTVVVTVDPTTSSVVLGDSLDLVVTVTNTGTAPTPPLVVHIDITDPSESTSVDPEDWTPTLSKRIGEVAPGDTITVGWTVQPISGGTFAVYGVALSPGVETISASNVLEVTVADQRSLNPGGILPVAIAVPSLIGVLLLIQMRFVRATVGSRGRLDMTGR